MEEPKNAADPTQAINAAKKDLELAYYHVKEALNFPNEPLKQLLADDLITMIEQFKTDILKESEPKDIFKRAFEALNDIDKKNFLADNLMEGLKRGESPAKLLRRFDKLGLLDLGKHKETVESQAKSELPMDDQISGWGRAIRFIKSCYRKIAIGATTLVNASVKAIPKLVNLEYKFAFEKGFMPEFAFGVGIDGETVQDILETVGDALWLQALREKEGMFEAKSTSTPEPPKDKKDKK